MKPSYYFVKSLNTLKFNPGTFDFFYSYAIKIEPEIEHVKILIFYEVQLYNTAIIIIIMLFLIICFNIVRFLSLAKMQKGSLGSLVIIY